MNSSNTTAFDGLGPHLDSAFQRLLLRSSLAGSKGATASGIRQFCHTMREFLQVDGVYFWRFEPPDDLVGAEADGVMTEAFNNSRLRVSENAILSEAIQQRKTVYVNQLTARYKLSAQFQARAFMASPLTVAGHVVGVVAFLHTSNPEFFNDEISAKAAILTVQLGKLLENSGSAVGRDSPRELIRKPTNPFDVLPDRAALMEGLADRLRLLLRTRLVCVLQRQGGTFALQSISSESPQLTESVRAQHDRRGMQFASDLAVRALSAGEPITVSIDPTTYALGDLVPAGVLIAAPFRTSQNQGAVLIYPRREGSFGDADKALVSAIVGFAAVGVAHAELHTTADGHAEEIQRMLDFVSELNTIEQPDLLMQKLALRCAEFLGFNGSCIAVKEDGNFHLRWKAEGGQAELLDLRLSFQSTIARSLLNKEVFSIADSKTNRVEIKKATDLELCQLLAVPLLAKDGSLLGMFAVTDRRDGAIITQDDIRRTQQLATHVASAMEKFRLFSRMEQANRHWVEIFDAISDFIVVHDQTSKVLRINRSLADFIGVAPSALIGVEMAALLGADDPTMVRSCPFCRAMDDSSDEYLHSIMEHTYRVSSSRTTTRDGLQTIHVLKDVTDSHEAERRYRELFSNIQEGLFFATPDGRFVEVNDALVRMLGYTSREELLQADIRSHVYVSEERYQTFAKKMQQHDGVKNHEETFTRKDGTPVYVLINGFAVRDAFGRIVQYRGLILDISGVKTFQTELQRERDFSGKILNHTQSLILVVDTAGLISYANRRWFDMGYEQRHLLGLPLRELVSKTRLQQLDEALRTTKEGEQVDNLDLHVLKGDGSIGQFSVNLSPMRDEQGSVNSVVVVMTDVTDAATLQAKLMHAEKMAAVGQLVSGVAHEVNNPLTAILGFADLLMDNNDLPEIVRRDLRVILQEAQRTKQIVQNLLSFARQMPPQRAPVQLNAILHRTVQLRAYDFHSHGIEIVEQLDESLPDVIGDSQQLQQVFLNIVNNAYDAVRETGRGPKVEIMTARRGQFVEVWFRDNGHGISFPDRIFDPFFTTKEVGKGTGLGLSICYGIVREHGGEILCQNNADGPGATFIVRLPSAKEGAPKGAIAGVSQL
jgi:PAS domain S-box-containing protein